MRRKTGTRRKDNFFDKSKGIKCSFYLLPFTYLMFYDNHKKRNNDDENLHFMGLGAYDSGVGFIGSYGILFFEYLFGIIINLNIKIIPSSKVEGFFLPDSKVSFL